MGSKAVLGTLETVVSRAVKTRINVAIVGDPGSGKTEIIERYCHSVGLNFEPLLTSSLDETDVAGLPVKAVKDTGVGVEYVKRDWSKWDEGVIFLDEFNCGRPDVTDTLLTLIQSRKFPDGQKLSDKVIFIAAMNDERQCGNNELSPAMRNRFAWFYHKTTYKQWLQEYASKHLPAWQYGFLKTLNIQFTKAEEFNSDDYCFTTGRSLTRLCNWSETVEEMKLFAPNFVGQAAAAVIKNSDYQDADLVGNAVFREDVTLSDPKAALFKKLGLGA